MVRFCIYPVYILELTKVPECELQEKGRNQGDSKQLDLNNWKDLLYIPLIETNDTVLTTIKQIA